MYICSTIMCDFISPIFGKMTHQKMMSNPSRGESRGVAIDPFYNAVICKVKGPKDSVQLVHITPRTVVYGRYIKIYQDISRYIKIYQDISRYIKIYQDISRYIKIYIYNCGL